MSPVRVAVLGELAKLGDEEALSPLELSHRLGIHEVDVNSYLHAGQLNGEVLAVPGGLVRLTPRMIKIMGPVPKDLRIAPARSFEKIRTALQEVNPELPQPLSEFFARTLAGLTNGVLTAAEAEARLTVEPDFLPLIRRMLGKEIIAEKAVIRVESGSQVSHFTIDKVAGRDIVNVTIHVHMPVQDQALSRGTLPMQRLKSTIGPSRPPTETSPSTDPTPDLGPVENLDDRGSTTMPQFEGGRAFIIGVADYDDPSLKIASKITVNEAQKVESSLKNSSVCAYPQNGITLVTDPDRKGLLDALDAFVKKVAADPKASTVVLFFAGHGVEGTDGNYYFTTRDTQLTAAFKAIPETAVCSTELMERLRRSGARSYYSLSTPASPAT